MVGLRLFRSSHRLFPQVGAEIADQIGKVFPVEGSDWLTLEGGQKPQLQVPEIGVVVIRCHHTRAVALGAFHLDSGGQGAVCTVCKVWFINNSAHAPAHSFQEIDFIAETGMVSNLLF